MVAGCRARQERGHGRGPVGRREGVFGLAIYLSLAQQTLESILTIQGDESLHVVGAQLVHDDVDHEPGNAGRCLCLQGNDRHEGHQRGE